jgi:drug/metabolite transporter (DMT)-like permease
LNSTLKAHLGLLGTNLFFATNYSAIKYFTSHHYAGPLGINIIRVGISAALFWILFLFKPSEKRIEKKDFPALILCTLTAIALNQLLFIQGLSLTFPIHAALLTLITPILITIIAARILKEKITIAKLVGLLLGAMGAVLLVSQREITAPGENVLFGDTLVILSAVAYTFYFILVKPLMNKYSAVQVIRWIFTIGFLMTLPFCYTEFTEITWQFFTFKDWFFLFMVVVPGTFLLMFSMFMEYKN